MFARFLARLAGRRPPSDDEITRELEDHLDLETEALARDNPEDASFAARRRFGNVSVAHEAVRDVWQWTWLDQLAQDLRHSARSLARSPVYAVAIIVTLAMGIGAGVSTYSFSRAIHDPFPRLPQDKLLWITQTRATCMPDCTQVSPAGFAALSTRAPSITPAGVTTWAATLRTTQASEPVRGFHVTPNTFAVIGAPFAAGRGFPSDAGQTGAPGLTVLSYDFWMRRFGGRRSIIDSLITLDGDPYRVVGVLGKDVIFPMAGDVYAPHEPRASEATDYLSRTYDVFARLSPGATFATAAAETRTIGAQLVRESPQTDSGWVLRARPSAEFHTDDVSILVQVAGVGALLVFLAACMSAANLALSRIATRRHELALRTALGVRRWRLVRHLLTESLLLSLAAALLGIVLARWGVRAIRDAIPASFAAFAPGWARLGIDAGAMAFALSAAALAVIVFGALPAFRASRVDLTSVLSDGGRASSGGVRSARTRATLIVIEVSSALVLLTAATLLARSVRNMRRGDAGVRIDHTLVMQFTLPPGMNESAQLAFYRRFDAALGATPGARAAGVATKTPLSNDFRGTLIQIPGRAPDPKGQPLAAIDQHVTPGYAEASGFRVVAGRMIGPQDVPGAQLAIVLNQMMADAFWPRGNALGEVVVIHDTTWTVVGVASNVRHGGLDEPMRYTVYRSILQSPLPYGVVAVWTRGEADAMRDVVQHVVARVDPSVAVGQIMSMDDMQARHVSPFSMMADMLGVLAAVTMTIAIVGLYGLVAYGVAQRTRELGVRVALGARPRDIVAHVAFGAMRLTLVAVAIGVVGAAIFARLLGALLYGLTASDPRTYVGVAAVLIGVALLAAFVPSWRAARLDPTIALRD